MGIEFSQSFYRNISDCTWSFGCVVIPSALLPSGWDNPTRGAALSRYAVISVHEKSVRWQCFVLRWYRIGELVKMRKCRMMRKGAVLTLALILSEALRCETLCSESSVAASCCCFTKWRAYPSIGSGTCLVCIMTDSSVLYSYWDVLFALMPMRTVINWVKTVFSFADSITLLIYCLLVNSLLELC